MKISSWALDSKNTFVKRKKKKSKIFSIIFKWELDNNSEPKKANSVTIWILDNIAYIIISLCERKIVRGREKGEKMKKKKKNWVSQNEKKKEKNVVY